jgi:small subunit ribosomal protein S6
VAGTDQIRRYETMIVLRADLQEAGTKEQLERIRKLLEANGGTVGGMHEWGVRELAYEIEKERRGYYVLAEYTGTAATVAELERSLKLSDAVLRFVSVRQEKEMPPAPSLPRYEAPAEVPGDLEDDDEEGLVGDAEVGDVE